jgi:glycosyltransferase involved in cell wall biosynthesis
MSISVIAVLRPILREDPEQPTSVSVLVPARNEKGNIGAALERLPDLGGPTEVIFVEGHSSDGTWDEIQRVAAAYDGPHKVVALKQTGRGKADAVRLGFSQAKGELLTILDADLTMPPELLPRFVSAYREGLCDFVNGSRIVYPMEGEAMRRLNRLGNVFFAKALTHVLGVRLGDSLCGTKLVRRDDYERMRRWRDDFGDFDPFGDFELLFPAATMGLGVIDVPIRYAARTYGSTQISRFRHGLMLLKMTAVGFLSVKMGKVPTRR